MRRLRKGKFCRRRLLIQGQRLMQGDYIVFDSLLNCDALTIGFARRFATYKRAPLIFQQMENIVKLTRDGLDAFLDGWYRQQPVTATFTGIHDHDHALPDLVRRGLAPRWPDQSAPSPAAPTRLSCRA